MRFLTSVFAALAAFSVAAEAAGKAVLSNEESSLTILYQNNLNMTDDANHASYLLLNSATYTNAKSFCAQLSESLLSKTAAQQHATDLTYQLAYVEYAGKSNSPQSYYIQDGILTFSRNARQKLKFSTLPSYAKKAASYPVLCTQSAVGNAAQVTVPSFGNTFTGYRDKKSFHFMGIPYAKQPQRFTHSKLLSTTGQSYNATLPGDNCRQWGYGSENCLFLNIHTPHIPKAKGSRQLRPVLFWIHGGGFTGGDGKTDGGDLASREDVVFVGINYRLASYGFMAIPGHLEGNYGIGDQITALDWVVKNIANFGGDPNKITIAGQSAGAGSVRVLLGSPKAIGKFASGIALANLGGGVGLGLSSNYGTTYSKYFTQNESYAVAGQNLLTQAGCNQTSLAAQVQCLKTTTTDLTLTPDVARYVVQDGRIVVTPELIVTRPNKYTAHVPVIFGIAANDGGSLGSYSRTCNTTVDCLAADTYISTEWSQKILDSGLFPDPATGDIQHDAFNISQRVLTDNTFRCIDSATVVAGGSSNAFRSAYYYEADRGFVSTAYNPNNVDVTGPITPGYPNGNPNLPYFKVHSSELPMITGGVPVLRDANDMYYLQTTMAYWGAFLRTGSPNPDHTLLALRGYIKPLEAVKKVGTWKPVKGKSGPVNILNYPPKFTGFQDTLQCNWLNISLNYFWDRK
ncbi:hypothetical protein HK097_003840 [Rhizophlyctis rosea]|uniref:Carboxylic ester hydrolase n=1 Tax=Rhizophlyctis rosea TaxID=64517 RepID=A0AAD5X2W8_9FUNG|nr:hypothetical protein HK097_003840 [Rhizophlyctis rosea]